VRFPAAPGLVSPVSRHPRRAGCTIVDTIRVVETFVGSSDVRSALERAPPRRPEYDWPLVSVPLRQLRGTRVGDPR